MKHFFAKPYRWAICISLVLVLLFTVGLLDSFVIPKVQVSVTQVSVQSLKARTQAKISDDSYEDDQIKIQIEKLRVNDTDLYLADIQLSDATLLKTALARNLFGRNVTETTSSIATANKAILAINGDFYGFRDQGFVLRNGTLYRESSNHNEALVIDDQGNFSIAIEDQSNAALLSTQGARQIFSFGPALIQNGEICINAKTEVAQSAGSNPRTAIGQISALHYLIIVSDGRSTNNKGLSLLSLAQEFSKRGCTVAYNLDGGGSSTLVFNGKVINQPTSGRSIKERAVSDIVYIGY